jgi:adenine-specific DNA-methyltransferase
LGPYIVDFLSMEARLIVEVNGSQYGELESRIKDQKRDQFLRNEGYEIIRLWDRDIQQHLEGCLRYLGEKIAERKKIE